MAEMETDESSRCLYCLLSTSAPNLDRQSRPSETDITKSYSEPFLLGDVENEYKEDFSEDEFGDQEEFIELSSQEWTSGIIIEVCSEDDDDSDGCHVVPVASDLAVEDLEVVEIPKPNTPVPPEEKSGDETTLSEYESSESPESD